MKLGEWLPSCHLESYRRKDTNTHLYVTPSLRLEKLQFQFLCSFSNSTVKQILCFILNSFFIPPLCFSMSRKYPFHLLNCLNVVLSVVLNTQNVLCPDSLQ